MAIPFWLTKLLVRTRLARFTPRARRLTDGGTAYLKYYSDRVLAAPLDELLDPAVIPHVPNLDILDLNQPTPDAPPARGAVSVGRTDAFSAPGRVPTTLPVLARIIADRYQTTGRTINPSTDILATHGATAAFTAALDAFVNPGDRVVMFDPCSPLFALGTKSRHANVRWVPTWIEDGRCRYIAATFERAMRGAKMLVLSDPGNPTGGCLANEDLEHIAWIAGGYGVLVYFDESFAAFRPDRARTLAAMPGADRLTLTAGSVSQEFGQPGMRVGWLAGPRHLVRACQLTANLTAPYVPPVCQQAAARLLAEPTVATDLSERFNAKRQYTLDRLRAMKLEPEQPGGGYFVWVPVSNLNVDGRTFAEKLLKEERVLVGPGGAFGPSGAGHIRVSFAADEGRLREGLNRLAAFVDRLRNPTTPTPPANDDSVDEPTTEITTEKDERRPAFSRA
ncbi:aspartate tyrosine aromatic aminotransferase : Aromatic amino acid aminotransferase OS=Desulfosporosinus sp. HMP52 GN=DP73_21835 PE=4 SV=1: Aminotran_1_2 [Gemmata massiliana]|uniref:Aminotransferase class I/classII large domain-containing protein n=1 Tax=Gemmata massiliana TaxID=1210884 RepID=A0A6P2CYT0_9BACT|nr:pyridoxal phosphate-dependent aminotransferase [Gemmata massiliana]VTR93717.1 aspartate tyrosine aromatic aminotransferase : Aromatic amino acid aminotransferase OS=Desulfosporosinus sp. HMP52 GN=DP73_21835 PE=4 SV=1: Aminotran_1_2 [Gemmata massiliana]